MKPQTAEYTIPGLQPSEVTALGAWDCHHCPHKSLLLDSHSRLHTPATSALRLSTWTRTDRNQIQLATGPGVVYWASLESKTFDSEMGGITASSQRAGSQT